MAVIYVGRRRFVERLPLPGSEALEGLFWDVVADGSIGWRGAVVGHPDFSLDIKGLFRSGVVYADLRTGR